VVAVKKIVCEQSAVLEAVSKFTANYQFIFIDMQPHELREGLALVKAWGKYTREAEER